MGEPGYGLSMQAVYAAEKGRGMYKAHIYIETDTKAPKKALIKYGYILSAEGSEHTRTAFGEVRDKTLHAAVLTAAVEALSRFTQSCEITIHTADAWIGHMYETALPAWAENGYRTKKGTEVSDRDLWEQLHGKTKGQKISFVIGSHEYSKWLISEMAREGKE